MHDGVTAYGLDAPAPSDHHQLTVTFPLLVTVTVCAGACVPQSTLQLFPKASALELSAIPPFWAVPLSATGLGSGWQTMSEGPTAIEI